MHAGFVTVTLVLTVCGCAPSPQVAVPPVPRGAEGTSIYNIWNHHNGRVPAVERSESGKITSFRDWLVIDYPF